MWIHTGQRFREGDGDRGQMLVQVAGLLVVLLILVAVAIDVGNIYQRRRLMQNSADAGALAGAREICFGDEGMAVAKAQEYAMANGATSVGVEVEDWTVVVTSTEAADMFAAGIIGLHTVDVGAVAAAACGVADSACGIWPVGLSEDRYEELWEAGCNTPFYVWSGDNDNTGPDCNIYDCDVNGDGVNDIVDQLHRAWLDFSEVSDPEWPDSCAQPGCGANELECWLEHDSGGLIDLGEDGECIPGDTGVKAGVKDAVESRAGDVVIIPVFDGLDCGGETCPGTSIHAVDLKCIEVVGWVQELTLPRLDGGQPPWKDKAIAAKISCEPCTTNCGSTGGEPPCPGCVIAVSLLR